MKKYDSYKDSGVEWIGEIPFDWNITRSKYYFENRVEKNNEDEPLLSVTQNKSVVRRDELETNVWNPDSDISGYKLIKKGDFVISLRTFEGGIELSEIQGIVSPVYSVLKLKKEVSRRYYKHLFKSNTFITELNKVTTGIRQGKNISFDDFSNISIPVPSINEQSSIGRYLDNKTSLIDSLIEKTKLKIQLLKENRTTLINEVVTKGLNPNVEMKDSGVEWIGEIPSHWELRKGSTIGNYSKGNGIKKDEVRETGLPCIRYGEIYTKYNHKFERVETFIEEGITDVKVPSGTLFMTGSGELLEEIGKCVVYVGQEELYVGGDIIILKPYSEFDSEFLSYQINSECIRIQRELNGRGGIIVHIYSKNFKDMWFPTPSLSEQNEIVSYLDKHTQLIDKTISIEEKRIELLKEYRQSLISEVVTGKRKVVV